uniref:Telomerase reverse transcriptase n=1 Tax=Crocodylus porosus TaxID=8502 RepID=A0A7M4F6S9_CROPO
GGVAGAGWGPLAVLRGCYAETLALEAFVQREQAAAEAGAGPELLRPADPALYRAFAERLVVAVPRGARALPRPLCFRQLSTMSDVIKRVVQRLCEKKKKNVLAFGYSLLDENTSHLLVTSTVGLCNYLPNTSTEALHTDGLWETLLSRIGDDLMMYLLEHCAVFMLVPPSCCYQICGLPLYELISYNLEPSPVFVKQAYSKRRKNVLLDYVQKKSKFRRNYLSQTNWKRKQSSEITAAVAPFKRKRGGDQLDISVKRVKITAEELEKETESLSSNVHKNKSRDAGSGYVESFPQGSEGGSSRVPAPHQALDTHDSQKFVADSENSFLLHDQSNKLSKPRTKTRTKSNREQDACKSQAGSAEVAEVEDDSLKYRGLKKNPTDLDKKLPKKTVWSAVYIRTSSLLYSLRSFQEGFPKPFLLNRLKCSLKGGQQLVEAIFLNGNTLQQKCHQNPLRHRWRKKRFPKRYWQMRNVFQELLKNHAKCPYLVLLKKNCPVQLSETSSGKVDPLHQSPTSEGTQIPRQGEDPLREGPGLCLRNSSGEGSGEGGASDSRPLLKRTSTDSNTLPEKPLLGHSPQDLSDSTFRELLKQHSKHWQVYVFVRECLERVVPAELWGSSHNKCRFFKNVKRFISLGRFAKISLHELMWKMRVNDCAWLHLSRGGRVPVCEHHFREELLAKFLYWLMNAYVIGLFRSFFYITETMFQKNMLFFYRKVIWSRLENIGIRNHFAKVHLRALSAEETEAIQQKKYIPAASKLRFIPKRNGLRPIVKMDSFVGSKKFSKGRRDRKAHYFNTRLKNLFSVLNYESTVNSSFLGSSVFGKDDIYKVWKNFVSKVLDSNDRIPHFYFVKADVSGAYDTIPHDKLVEVILQILNPEERTTYCIRRYAVIKMCTNGQIRKYYRRHVATFKDFISYMGPFVSSLQESTSLENAIVIEQSLSFNETSSSLFDFFLQTIRNNILEIKGRCYLQCCGIPQGSILSTLLCSLCYGDMENKLLCGIQQDGVLIRLIDDFLLVTPHLLQAKNFLRTLAAGIPEYGFSVNSGKMAVNFLVDDDDIPGCSQFKQLPDCRMFQWCGLLLDTQTLEIYCDYSSYASTSIRSSLVFNSSRTAGKNMKSKLNTVLKLKCHSLFLDLQINSLRTVFMNVYKIFLLQAYRFHACVLQLPFNQQVRNNPCFFLRIISDTASCCYSALKVKNSGSDLGAKGASGPFPSEAAEWLCYHAFIRKLSKHKIIYKCLLRPLQMCELKLFRKIAKTTMQLLKAVTKPSLCKDFKDILD